MKVNQALLTDIRVGDWVVADGCKLCDPDDVKCGPLLVGSIGNDGWIRFVRQKGVKYAWDTLGKIHIDHVRPAFTGEVDEARYARKANPE